MVGEINELGVLVKQLAVSVASHDDHAGLGAAAGASPGAVEQAGYRSRRPNRRSAAETAAPIVAGRPGRSPVATAAARRPLPPRPRASRNRQQLLAAVKNAVEENRLDIYLQPMVTLPQRKVRFYEAVTRLRDDKDQILAADDFIATAEAGGLIGRIDHMVMLRCVQVLRRLMVRNKDVGVFCNVSAATLGNPDQFRAMPRFPRGQSRAGAVLRARIQAGDVPQSRPDRDRDISRRCRSAATASRSTMSPTSAIEPRELADRGVRFIKVPAALLLDPKQTSTSDIHPSDLSDLLGRFGIDLIAERIEGERAVVDLLDYDVRFGQGFLFAPPRPLRPEGASATGGAPANKAPESSGSNGSSNTAPLAGPAIRAAAAGDRQCRAGAPRRRTGLTGARCHDHTCVSSRSCATSWTASMSCSPTSGAWCITGSSCFPEACEALHTFRKQGGTVILITNAPRPADSVQRQLRKLGVADETYDAIVSSGDLTRHLRRRPSRARRCSGSAPSATIRSIAGSMP